MQAGQPCRSWERDEAQAIYDLPWPELMFRAQTVHRQHFDPAEIEQASLLSIKTGGCPEDCGYCSQSGPATTPASQRRS